MNNIHETVVDTNETVQSIQTLLINTPYSLENDVDVKISVYDMLGTLVYDFKGGRQYAGIRSIEWNATNNSGQRVPAGIYFYKLNAGEQVSTKKMILLK